MDIVPEPKATQQNTQIVEGSFSIRVPYKKVILFSLLILLTPLTVILSIRKTNVVQFADTSTSTITGNFESVNNRLCLVSGWAKDSLTTSPINIRFYKDGPIGNGPLITESTAGLLRNDLPFIDKYHGFSYVFNLNSSIDDDASHVIYAYGYNATTHQYALLGLKTIQCKKPIFLSIPSTQPYLLGAYYYTAWSSVNQYLITNTQKTYGASNPWGGVQQYAAGQDPWGIYTFSTNIQELKQNYAARNPQIGYYDMMQQSTVDTHIQQAISHGLSYFDFYWYWDNVLNQESFVSSPIHKFLTSSYKNQLKFMLGPIILQPQKLTISMWQDSVVPFFVSTYVTDPDYLTTTDGRPIIDDWTYGQYPPAFHTQLMQILRSSVQKTIGKDPVILGIIGRIDTPEALEKSIPNPTLSSDYDGYHCFVFEANGPADDYINNVSYGLATANNLKRFFYIPCATQGYDPRPWFHIALGVNNDISFLKTLNYYTSSSIATFTDQIQKYKQFIDANPLQTAKMLTVYAWNEWGEGGSLEPDVINGDAYLKAIQNVFGLLSKNIIHGNFDGDIATNGTPFFWGWVCQIGYTNSYNPVDFYMDGTYDKGTYLGRISNTSLSRPDLYSNGTNVCDGTTTHGFSFDPKTLQFGYRLFDNVAHVIYAYGIDLSGQGKNIFIGRLPFSALGSH